MFTLVVLGLHAVAYMSYREKKKNRKSEKYTFISYIRENDMRLGLFGVLLPVFGTFGFIGEFGCVGFIIIFALTIIGILREILR